MKISTQQHMLALTKKMHCFGCFDVSYMVLDASGQFSLISSLNKSDWVDPKYIFSERFLHFLSMLPVNASRFYSEKSDLFNHSPLLNHSDYVAFVKKTYTQKIKIYLFHASKRSEVVHLLLHKEVMKRMALYMEEHVALKKPYGYAEKFSELFAVAAASYADPQNEKSYMNQVLHSFLTKKERDLVYLLLELHSVTQVAERVGFSRSYVSQLLLSAAHKLGLSQIAELLSMDKTNGVLLKMGETNVERYC